MNATYVSSTSFRVSGNYTTRFVADRKVKAYCGSVDGYKYCTIESSSYSAPDTTVVVSGEALTSNLATVMLGVVSSGSLGSMPRVTPKGRVLVQSISDFVNTSDVTEFEIMAPITLISNIDLGGKGLFVNLGCIVTTGAHLLSNFILLSTGAYQQFDTSGSGSASPIGMKEILAQWWGGNPDYNIATGAGTDNAAAINAAAVAAANSTLRITHGYWGVDSAVLIPSTVNLAMDGMVVYKGSSDITVLTIGDATTYVMQKSIEVNVACGISHAGTWASENFIGAKIINAYDSTVRVITAGDHLVSGLRGFTIGLYMVGDTKGSYYNNIELLKIAQNKIGLDLKGNGSGGYFNENKFHGGNFRASNNTGEDRIAVRLSGEHNVFFSPSFEHGGSSIGGTPYCFDVTGSRNKVWDARNEIKESGYLIRVFGAASNDNEMTTAEGAGNEVFGRIFSDESTLGRNWINRQTREFILGMTKEIHRVANPGLHFATYGSSNEYTYVPGLMAWTSDGLDGVRIPRAVTMGTDNSLVLAGGYLYVGAYVNTEAIKHFSILGEWNTATGDGAVGRVVVICYDAAGNVLSGTSPRYAYRLRGDISSGARELASYTLGGITGYRSYEHATESIYPFGVKVSDDVKKVWLGVELVGGGASLRSFAISIRQPNDLNATPATYAFTGQVDKELLFVSNTAPTIGTYAVGKVVWRRAPAAGSNLGWINTASGWIPFGAAQSADAWTISNVTTTRTFDANSSDLAVTNDVLASLVNELKASGILK